MFMFTFYLCCCRMVVIILLFGVISSIFYSYSALMLLINTHTLLRLYCSFAAIDTHGVPSHIVAREVLYSSFTEQTFFTNIH